MSPSIVSLKRVSRRFVGDIFALREVSLEIARGELVAIVGPSGSGKSTMLNIIGTLDRASSGTVEIDGLKLAELNDDDLSALRAHRIGFVFQHFHLSPGVSALDNVADGLLYTGTGLRQRRERAEAALRDVGLGHRLDHRPHQLSGGEKQRTAIARALARRPLLLLADEPTGALDSSSGEGVVQLLLGLHRQGTAVVVITHDRDLAARFDRQATMRDGQLVADTRREAA
ncbi:MAG TPA: ABC transporter ATP-binding protein [Devosia sp.]|jgi:putative ABC transport system ATP-binding protein|uniref:ABC transporter ATP-binding protein n=1 Tax=Devosia sp. TaxID=1871048 RepID=UPI002DDCE4FE|nr:ABC transporter ATP-binding protein [Devosia sp.]HEV2515752.1 ABC transporter ATP-binding protein [Devosia sp.]